MRPQKERALFLFHLEHEFPHIQRYRIHPQGIQTPFKHVRLDSGLVERCSPCTDSLVGILSEEQIHLFECSSVCFDTVEAPHVNDCRGYFYKLVNPGNVFSRTLPHIPVHQGKLYFTL